MAPELPVTIRALDPRQLDDLRPLWLALRDHHDAITPEEWGPVLDDDASWAQRRETYRKLLSEPGSFSLVARAGDPITSGYPHTAAPLAYAMVSVTNGSPTWANMQRVGYLETLSVAPYARGRGVGKTLLDAVRARLLEGGMRRLELTAVVYNERARSFYEREGFANTFVTMGAELRAIQPGRPRG